MHLFHKWIPIYEPKVEFYLGETYGTFTRSEYKICSVCGEARELRAMYGSPVDKSLNSEENKILMKKLFQIGNKLVINTEEFSNNKVYYEYYFGKYFK